MSIRSQIRSFCKIDTGGGGGRGVGLSLGCHCGVTYQILGLYVNPFSDKEFLQNLYGWEGGEWSEFGLSLWCHIPNFRSVCESVLS